MANSHITDLSNFLSSDQITTDPSVLSSYGRDWTKFYLPNPIAVVFPRSAEQVSQVVKWAQEYRVALVPSGGRTGLSGGAVAENGEVVVSFDKMNSIVSFNEQEESVTCQAGVITEELQRFAESKGLYFPVDFASRGSSQIGGNIATNAGGIKVLRYGLMRDWVTSIEFVTGTGDILHLNRNLIKNASGYDLRHLVIGSEGTLGFITSATIRLTTPPPPLHVMVLGTNDLSCATEVLNLFRKKVQVEAFEMFSEKALRKVLSHHDLKRPFENETSYYLLLEFEETNDNSIETAISCFEEVLEKKWIVEGVMSQNPNQSKEFWSLRELISESLSHYTPYKNDISTTISNVPAFVKEIDTLLLSLYPHFEVIWFGHVGDGNLHINILKPKDLKLETFVQECRKVDQLLFQTIQKFQGSISAEHGVGLVKKSFLSFSRSPAEIEIMKGIKKIFDPDAIINPGKIFDP